MATSWTFVETSAATAAVWLAIETLQRHAESSARSHTPRLEKAAIEIGEYLDAYKQIKASTDDQIEAKVVQRLNLYELSRISRFYRCQIGPWAGVYWIDTETKTCVSCFSYYAPSRPLLAGPAENMAFKSSPLIAGIFGLLEQFIVQMLKSDRGIAVTLDEE